MKKKILILSAAMLAVVVGAALLQSCSSDSAYEEPAYGYYTEEEINVIKAMAEIYEVDVEVDPAYNGKKLTLEEIEKDLIAFSNLPGEYELVPNKDSTEFHFVKKESLNRSVTRSVELANTGEFVLYKSDMPFGITVSWQFASKKGQEDVVTCRASYPFRIQGGGGHTLCRDYLSLSHTYTFYHLNTSYGRYNISGIYYPDGRQEFRILKVQVGEKNYDNLSKEE